MRATPPPRSFHRGTALLVAAAFFMENLDGTIIQTAAPTMARDLAVAPVDLNLPMVAYLMTVAVFIPATAWLADRWGVRRVFMTAVALFTLASLACAVSGSLGVLTAARVAQGLGGALMVPVGRLAILRTTDTRDLLPAMAYLTWPGLIAPVVAPLLGGLLAETVGWPWIFLLNVPLGLAALVVGPRLLPGHRTAEVSAFDWRAFATLGVGLGLVTAGGEGLDGTSGSAVVTGALTLAAGVGLCGFAVLLLRRREAPLLRLDALATASFRVGNVSGAVYRLLVSGAPFLFTLFLQVRLGYSAVQAGAMIIAIFIGNIAIKPFTTPLLRRLGFRSTLVGANAAGLAVLAACAAIGPRTPVWVVVALLGLSGVFRSIGFSGYNTLQFVDVPRDGMNDANTLSSTLQQIATALGIAVVALLARLGQLAADATGHDDAAYPVAFLLAAALMLVPLLGSLMLPRDAGSAATARP